MTICMNILKFSPYISVFSRYAESRFRSHHQQAIHAQVPPRYQSRCASDCAKYLELKETENEACGFESRPPRHKSLISFTKKSQFLPRYQPGTRVRCRSTPGCVGWVRFEFSLCAGPVATKIGRSLSLRDHGPDRTRLPAVHSPESGGQAFGDVPGAGARCACLFSISIRVRRKRAGRKSQMKSSGTNIENAQAQSGERASERFPATSGAARQLSMPKFPCCAS